MVFNATFNTILVITCRFISIDLDTIEVIAFINQMKNSRYRTDVKFNAGTVNTFVHMPLLEFGIISFLL